MAWIKNFIFNKTKSIALSKLKNPKFKKFLIARINVTVDIPVLNEKQEEQLIAALYTALEVRLSTKR